MLLAALRVITARNPVHAVLFLVLAFFSAACLWILLRGRVPRDRAGAGLRRRGDGAVPVRGDDARHQHRPAAPGLLAPRAAGGVGIAALIVLQMWLVLSQPAWQGMTAPGPGIARRQQHQGARPAHLHGVRVPAADRGRDPAGGHHRRDRADAARAQGLEVPGPSRQVKVRREDRVRLVQTMPSRERHARGKTERTPDKTATREEGARAWCHCPGIWVSARCCSRSACRHLPEPQEPDRAADGDRADAARGQHQLRRVLALPGDYHGQVFVFFILTVAAAESAIGLAILVVLFRNLSTINVEELDALKG